MLTGTSSARLWFYRFWNVLEISANKYICINKPEFIKKMCWAMFKRVKMQNISNTFRNQKPQNSHLYLFNCGKTVATLKCLTTLLEFIIKLFILLIKKKKNQANWSIKKEHRLQVHNDWNHHNFMSLLHMLINCEKQTRHQRIIWYNRAGLY